MRTRKKEGLARSGKWESGKVGKILGGTCVVVSRVVVDICNIRESGALGHKEWQGHYSAHRVRK